MRSPNAQLAVKEFDKLLKQSNWTAQDAWKGIAVLLLTCEIWRNSAWQPFHGTVVYREANDFPDVGSGRSNEVLTRSQRLTNYLASRLGGSPAELCSLVGAYWRQPQIRDLQPHNLVGHAFRSLTVHILQRFGDPGIGYEEEVDAGALFPGAQLHTRSKRPKIDIVAKRGGLLVALLSVRWRFRHDRVDVVDEAQSYVPAAIRQNRNCKFYAVLGECSPSRLEKVLFNTYSQQFPNAAIWGTVHFHPEMITDSESLAENGRLKGLQSLAWLIGETSNWR